MKIDAEGDELDVLEDNLGILLDVTGLLADVSRNREEIFNLMADFGRRPIDINGADLNGIIFNSANNLFFYEI